MARSSADAGTATLGATRYPFDAPNRDGMPPTADTTLRMEFPIDFADLHATVFLLLDAAGLGADDLRQVDRSWVLSTMQFEGMSAISDARHQMETATPGSDQADLAAIARRHADALFRPAEATPAALAIPVQTAVTPRVPAGVA